MQKNLIHPKHYVLIFYEYHQQLNLTQFDFTLLDLILPKPAPTRAKYFRTEIWPDFTWTRTDMKWSWPIFTLFKPMTHGSWVMAVLGYGPWIIHPINGLILPLTWADSTPNDPKMTHLSTQTVDPYPFHIKSFLSWSDDLKIGWSVFGQWDNNVWHLDWTTGGKEYKSHFKEFQTHCT